MKLIFIYLVTDCHASCLHCSTVGCVKCPNYIINPTRECVKECPRGYRPTWSTEIDFMGRMCVHSGYIAGLSAEHAAILIGVLSGTLICVIIISSGVLFLRYKRRHSPNTSSETPSDIDDSPERKDFVKQLEILRPQAPTFLSMLNDTRRQIRELHSVGDNAAITAYRPVVRDLAKILLLLNRHVDRISVIPEDWDHLFSWGEKVLKRYKRMSDISQPQVAQLVSFLQAPVIHEQSSPTYANTTLSTFKPDQQLGSTMSLKDIAVKNFDNNYDNTFTTINPQWQFNYSLVGPNTVSTSGYYGSWQNKDFLCSTYLVEDDFFQFGFRPQDEITTEL